VVEDSGTYVEFVRKEWYRLQERDGTDELMSWVALW
jgi:hypothetical protein